MRLKLPRKNKRWQATWPDTIIDFMAQPPELTDINEPVPLTDNVSPRKLRRWLMTAFVLLMLALLGAVTWLSYRYQASQASLVLDEDAAKASAQIRQQLLRDVQTLQLLVTDTSDPSKQKQVHDKIETLLAVRPEIVRMQWWRTEVDQAPQLMLEMISGAAPVGIEKAKSSIDFESLSPEATLALATTRVSKREQFSQPYTLPLGNNLGIESMDL